MDIALDFQKRKLVDPTPNCLPLILRHETSTGLIHSPDIYRAPTRCRRPLEHPCKLSRTKFEIQSQLSPVQCASMPITSSPYSSGGRTCLCQDELSRRAVSGGLQLRGNRPKPELVKHGCDSHGPLRACC